MCLSPFFEAEKKQVFFQEGPNWHSAEDGPTFSNVNNVASSASDSRWWKNPPILSGPGPLDSHEKKLVGGWTNPYEKYALQIS